MSALPNGLSHPKAGNDSVAVLPSRDPAIQDASTEAEMRAALAALHERETKLCIRLDGLVASQTDMSRDLGRLDMLRAGLGAQVIATRSISNNMLSTAAETAGRLSDKVKELDLEKSRVEDTLSVVEQVAELRACVHGVVGSMGAPQDWEAAAAYLDRASKVPDEITRGAFAASIVPSVEVPDPPWVTLENAKESLCGLFLREFERAAGDGDGTKVTRFFKLFPLIGRAEVGLDVYGRYVCQGVAGTARATLKDGLGGHTRKEGFFYANSLTKLFEHIAQIVEGHGGLVERHYGSGRMVRVIERLQMEADVQGGIIIDTWSDERTIDRKLTDVKSYPFSFLVKSFLPPQSRSGTPRVNSPAVGGPNNGRESEDEGVNMKEIDGLLNEISLMLGRWSLYTRFIAGKCRNPVAPEDAPLVMPDVLVKSTLYRKVTDRLATPYNVMAAFFFRRSVEKAFQLDEYPSGLSLSLSRPIDANAPYIILAVDDVMYIVNTVIQKTISTSQRDVVGSVVPTLSRIMSADFITMIQRKMRDDAYPKPIVTGGFPPEDKIIQFIVLINSLDMSNEYLQRIISGRIGSHDAASNGVGGQNLLQQSFPFERDVAFVISTLQSFENSFLSKSRELLSEGIHHLVNQVIKPRLRPVLTDTFRDVDYTLTEDEIAEIAQQNDEDEEEFLDQVSRRFEYGWDQLMKPIARIMTPGTFNILLDSTARHVAKLLEKRILLSSGRMNAFGAIRVERDFTGIIDTVSRGDYRVREVFGRLTQLLMVANMEDDEWEEVNALSAADGIEWKLTEEERKKARSLSADISALLLPAATALYQATRALTSLAGPRFLFTRAWNCTAEMETRIIRVPSKPPLGQFAIPRDASSRLERWEVDVQDGQTLKSLQDAGKYLREKDTPVAFPTETVYGLGADATRSAAVKGIYAAKGRPSDNPLIVHVSDLEMLRNLLSTSASPGTNASENEDPIPARYKPLIERFWPGPLTILLPNPQPSKLAPEVTAGLPTFGVRMPSSSLALSLIKAAQRPLAAPSANASTKPSPTTAHHVQHDLSGRIELIIDGGSCQVGVESTVVDGLCDPPVVLRPGGVGIDELRSCPGWENVTKGYKDASEVGQAVPRAPGMKYKHYSPKARVVLYESSYMDGNVGVTPADYQQLFQPITNGVSHDSNGHLMRTVGIIRTRRWHLGGGLRWEALHRDTNGVNGGDTDDTHYAVDEGTLLDQQGKPAGKALDIDLGTDTRGIAQGLFSALRELDERGAEVIFVDGIDDKLDIAAAVMNRLRKAASEIRS